MMMEPRPDEAARAVPTSNWIVRMSATQDISEEMESRPFQGRNAVIQLNWEQMARCNAVQFALSSQKK
jgi:hypothetical protein